MIMHLSCHLIFCRLYSSNLSYFRWSSKRFFQLTNDLRNVIKKMSSFIWQTLPDGVRMWLTPKFINLNEARNTRKVCTQLPLYCLYKKHVRKWSNHMCTKIWCSFDGIGMKIRIWISSDNFFFLAISDYIFSNNNELR